MTLFDMSEKSPSSPAPRAHRSRHREADGRAWRQSGDLVRKQQVCDEVTKAIQRQGRQQVALAGPQTSRPRMI